MKNIMVTGFFFTSSALSMVSVKVDHTIYEPQQVCETISKQNNPHIVVWFEGESGTRRDGFSFYKNHIFNAVKNPSAKFHLYDLSAWKRLRDLSCPLDKQSKISQHIDSLELPRYSSLYSAYFFRDLLDLPSTQTNYLQDQILTNPHLLHHSSSRRTNGITLQQALDCNALASVKDMDTAHAYSLLQYVEALCLVRSLSRSPSCTNITFLLPNDESKYYATSQLEEDIKNFLSPSHDKDLTVSFTNFKYRDSSSERPYISRGKKLTKTFISHNLPD